MLAAWRPSLTVKVPPVPAAFFGVGERRLRAEGDVRQIEAAARECAGRTRHHAAAVDDRRVGDGDSAVGAGADMEVARRVGPGQIDAGHHGGAARYRQHAAAEGRAHGRVGSDVGEVDELRAVQVIAAAEARHRAGEGGRAAGLVGNDERAAAGGQESDDFGRAAGQHIGRPGADDHAGCRAAGVHDQHPAADRGGAGAAVRLDDLGAAALEGGGNAAAARRDEFDSAVPDHGADVFAAGADDFRAAAVERLRRSTAGADQLRAAAVDNRLDGQAENDQRTAGDLSGEVGAMGADDLAAAVDHGGLH